MAEIHPNDIGLATYDDVGDVANLKTTAKKIVDAINEMYENGGNASGVGEQKYVEGENNTVIGGNNVVYGNNNLIVGSDNVIVGDDLVVIGSIGVQHYDPTVLNSFYFGTYNSGNNSIYYSSFGDSGSSLSLNPGDKVMIRLTRTWTDENWEEYVTVDFEPVLCEISSMDENYIYLTEGIDKVDIPPDDVHTVENMTNIIFFIPLTDAFKLTDSGSGLCFGDGKSIGTHSAAIGLGSANGTAAFAANSGEAKGIYAAGLNDGMAYANFSFCANRGKSEGIYGTAINSANNYSPYSLAMGYSSKVVGRVLKCESLDTSNRKITLSEGQNTENLTGKRILIRCYTGTDVINFREGKIQSVNGNILTLTDISFSMGSNGDKLFAEAYAFIGDSSITYANGEFAGGYYAVAGYKASFAYGTHVLVGAEGTTVFGKYGNVTDAYAIALANGTSLFAPGLAFKALNDGSVHADGEYTTPCADYAEFFEWDDGNPDNEDRTGYFVKLKGDKITKCDEFDTPLGIVSATPAIIGDSGEMHWKDKFLTDDFGRVQYHDVIVPEELDDEGNIIIEEHMETQPVINPDWNNEETYIPRSERKEWSPVGVLGKLIVYDDGTLTPGDICRPGKGGIAVKSVKNGYQVLKRISQDKVLIWFYPTGHEKG